MTQNRARCSTCGADNDLGRDRYCHHCGASLMGPGDVSAQSAGEPAGSPSTDPTGPPPQHGRASRRTVLIAGAITVVVAVGVIVGVLVGTSGGDSGSGPADPSGPADSSGSAGDVPTLIMDRHQACAAEVRVGASILDGSDASIESVVNAVGAQTPQFPLYSRVFAQFSILQSQSGVASANAKIGTYISQSCTESADPLLTSGQVAALGNLADADGAAALSHVGVFE